MPLYPTAKDLIRKNLEALQAGQRVPRVTVGKLTKAQIEAVNAQQAAEDLPLHRYTKLEFPGARNWYEHPPWDWWKFDFVGSYKNVGNELLAFFVFGFVAGIVLWIRGAAAPCAETGPCGRLRLWPRLWTSLGPRMGRLRDRLRGRGR